MLKFLKILVAGWILFIVLSVIGGGGDQFRSIHDKTNGVTQKIADFISDKADGLKEDADNLKNRIKDWTGGKKELAKKAY